MGASNELCALTLGNECACPYSAGLVPTVGSGRCREVSEQHPSDEGLQPM